MQKIFVFIALSICAACNSNKIKLNDIKNLKLSGNVKSVTESSFNAIEKFGEIEKLSQIPDYYVYKNIFDKDGYQIESSMYNGNGILFQKSIKKYDAKRNVIENTSYNNDGTISQKSIINYNTDNKVTEDNGFDKTGSLEYKHVYSYDNKGLNFEFKWYDKNNILQSTAYRKYDKNGFMSESNTINAIDKTLSYKITYVNDEKGNNLLYNEYNFSGFQTKRFSYKYDTNGNRIEEINLEQSENNPDGISNVKRNYKYDLKNYEIEYHWADLNGTGNGTFTYKYEFDKENNWIKKIEFENNVPKKITERVIEYY